MESVELLLPHISLWSRKSLAECGLDPDLKYHSARFKTLNGTPLITGYVGEVPVSHTMMGNGATLYSRLMCIKGKSGSTDARLHESILEAGDRIILDASFDVERRP